jgi:hypothetical protein
MTQIQKGGIYGISSVGLFSSAIALVSSRLDRAMFCLLSSGSILLALAMASGLLNLIFRGLTRLSEREKEQPAMADSEFVALPKSNRRRELRSAETALSSVGD